MIWFHACRKVIPSCKLSELMVLKNVVHRNIGHRNNIRIEIDLYLFQREFRVENTTSLLQDDLNILNTIKAGNWGLNEHLFNIHHYWAIRIWDNENVSNRYRHWVLILWIITIQNFRLLIWEVLTVKIFMFIS